MIGKYGKPSTRASDLSTLPPSRRFAGFGRLRRTPSADLTPEPA
ncbi:hypothetical protein OG453_01365 [Streptomyces sp. NBC_01381]|nr:hypothetical protein [Streptomyces sp. NBC_01381]MCX4665334.1 hypothetical protein [Streptomyces sp. NBC_01381]